MEEYNIADSESDASSVVDGSLQGAHLGANSAGQGSMRSRGTRFSRVSREPSVDFSMQRARSQTQRKEDKTKSIFEWNGGGRNVHITGSWDNFSEKLPMESIRPGFYRIVLPIPSTERVEYYFFVDGERRVASDLPAVTNELGEFVNVKHADPTVVHRAGRVRKILSKISGLDLYSPFQKTSVASMILFRVFYILTFPAACYYFYWLLSIGGNEQYPFIWITFVVAEFMSLGSAAIGLFSMWKPIKRKWRSLDSLKPPLPAESWPTVDIIIAHYKEEPSQVQDAIRCALNLDYPSHLLHIIIADDGYFASPKVVERTELGVRMYQMLAEEAGYDPLMDEIIHDNGLVEHYTVRSGEEELARMDCALESHVFSFGPFTPEEMQAPGSLPRLSLVARVKPENHHNKAGNINNVLFNSGTDGKLLLFLVSCAHSLTSRVRGLIFYVPSELTEL